MYATRQNMIDRYGDKELIELTDRVEPYTGIINDAVLDAAIATASATIDSYVSKRYDLPFAVVPAVLVPHAQAITWYTLHRGNYSDPVRLEYEDALSFLSKVSKGDVLLDAAGTQPPSAPAEARVEGPDRMFSRDSMKGY